jgi:hypothetical protein
VLAFCDTYVDIQMSYGVVTLMGSGFELAIMENDRLVIRGYVESVHVRRRC